MTNLRLLQSAMQPNSKYILPPSLPIALDAYCLLEVYKCLKSQAVSMGGAMPLEPTLEYQKEVLKLERQKRRSKKKEKKAAKKDNVN